MGGESLGCKLPHDESPFRSVSEFSLHLKDMHSRIWFFTHPLLAFSGNAHVYRILQVYEFVKAQGFIPYDTCMPYLACSDDSKEGFCQHVDTSCQKHNICRTCSTFSSFGGTCVEVRCSYVLSDVCCIIYIYPRILFNASPF